MPSPSDEEQLREAITGAAKDSKVPCRFLLALAERTDTPPAQIGRLCDEMGVHIRACQLGCFK
ncbi:MAG: hypothetical protein HQ546_10175 [Planctomycetes bacterium]|nr:hypothetical protein [Planctomycetota bacterium]